MKALPDLDRLSVSEKDDLIPVRFGQVHVLTVRVTELEGRLAGQTAKTEAKPPSSDGLSRAKPKSQRHKGLNSTGGKKAFDAFGILAVFAGTPVALA